MISPPAENMIPHPLPLPPVPPISPFANQFPGPAQQPSLHRPDYHDRVTVTPDLGTQELQHITNSITRTERRQAHTERKVKAWIRSTTPEFDLVTGDDAVHTLQGGLQPRPTFKRAASSPYILGRPYDPQNQSTTPPSAHFAPQAGQAINHSQYQEHQSSENKENLSTDYRNPDPYASGAFVPIRHGSLPDPHYRRPSASTDTRSQIQLSPGDQEPPSKQPRRPNPFSRGSSAGDIHTARLREIHNPSLSSIATHHTTSSAGTKKSRPSISNASSMPRSEKAHEGVAVGGVAMERKSPRKQPSLMKGLRGSLFGLLHKGEGDESRARRKESKADLRALALQSYTVPDQVVETPTPEESIGAKDQETHHLLSKEPSLNPPSSTMRPHLRRSSNSAPDHLPRTRLFMPITLRQAHAPSAWDPHVDMIASDSVESLASPPRSSSLPQGRNEECLPSIPLFRDKPPVRQFRSGSDTATWEKRPHIPLIPHRNLSNIAGHGLPLDKNPSILAREIATHTKLLAPSSPELRKTHRPRSQSWSAAQALSAVTIQPLRLRKKRSEPILSSKMIDTIVEDSDATPARNRPRNPHDPDNNAQAAQHQHVEGRPLHSAEATSTKLARKPVHVSDIFASPTNSETQRQEAAMKALEKALGAPTWADVDFHATRRTNSSRPRPISPKTNDRSLHTISPNISPNRTISVLKTPPRDPLPRVPSLSTPRRRVPPALNLTRTPDQPHSGSNKKKQQKLDAYLPLPRLSYSFYKEAAGNRKSKAGPRLVSVIFPSSAPATKVDFDMVPPNEVHSARETVRGSDIGRQDDLVDWEAKYEMVARDLGVEREKSMKSESDLMRLHGKYLGAVKRISQ